MHLKVCAVCGQEDGSVGVVAENTVVECEGAVSNAAAAAAGGAQD